MMQNMFLYCFVCLEYITIRPTYVPWLRLYTDERLEESYCGPCLVTSPLRDNLYGVRGEKYCISTDSVT
jgi:hypothetical protein